jgi:arylsulfatase
MKGKTGLVLAVGALFLSLVVAQQVTGVPGSPSATTTIDGKQLPAPHRNSAG